MMLYLNCVILGAILYRMGGSDKYDTKWRDFGLPYLALVFMMYRGMWHWSLWICALLMFGALTTYWKCLNKWNGQPKTDAFWFNWIAHGVGIGLAFLPYAYFTGCWEQVIMRAEVLGLTMMLWSEKNDNAVWEECGRGVLTIGTLWLI